MGQHFLTYRSFGASVPLGSRGLILDTKPLKSHKKVSSLCILKRCEWESSSLRFRF